MKFLKKIGLSVLFASVLALGTTSANAECKARLGDFDWSSANIHTAITDFILTNGYGCQVEVTKGSTTPIMAAHYDKQLDVITEVWYDNIIANYEPHEAAGTIMNIGVNTPDSQQAFYVDKTTADKYNLARGVIVAPTGLTIFGFMVPQLSASVLTISKARRWFVLALLRGQHGVESRYLLVWITPRWNCPLRLAALVLLV